MLLKQGRAGKPGGRGTLPEACVEEAWMWTQTFMGS